MWVGLFSALSVIDEDAVTVAVEENVEPVDVEADGVDVPQCDDVEDAETLLEALAVAEEVDVDEDDTDGVPVAAPVDVCCNDASAEELVVADADKDAVSEFERKVGSDEGVTKFERTLPEADADATVIVTAADVDMLP